jgi:hypothetical protein
MILNNTKSYLGQKGYTILKNDITIEKQIKIRNELTIKPYTPGSLNNNITTYPAYRESDKKMYIPHYYGIENFGPPKTIKISDGNDINLEFNGSLRDYQEPVVKKYIEHVNKTHCGGGLLELPCAYGKCLGKNTEILMYDGTIKKVQDIKVGDLLMGDDSKPRNVLSLARGIEQMYKISSKKGDSYICNESHILSLKSSSNHSKKIKKGDIIDISVIDYLNLPKCFHSKNGILLGYKVPIDFEEKIVEFEPYLIGYWLGNDLNRHTRITTQKSSVIKYIVDLLKKKHNHLYLEYTGNQYDYKINSIKDKNSFEEFLKTNNLLNKKHIPHIYLCNSRKIRLELLAGIIDSQGYFNNKCIKITQKNEIFLNDIIFLARSLGFSCYKKQVQKTCKNLKNEPIKVIYFWTNICGKGIEEIPTLFSIKKYYIRKQIKNPLTYRLQIEKLNIDEYFGFEIDGNRRFVLANFTVTHNTVLSLNIISQLKKKTLVIVHKEFLMNQWIERIQEFLPKAKIGKIQGQIIDIDDKDIVIGMLQSLSMKEYPENIFKTFGFTIIDEVHHISSEVFSNTLFKLVTKYMLGLSATMNRKDGTTKVFKMFLGNVIYKGKVDEERNVIVKAIEYSVDDDEFNKVITDFRGNFAYSSMISKLCEYNRRSEFIIKILKDLLNENENQQIMILAHNKNLLKYIHDAIKHRNISTVGYYVGGMKELALKESETKKVIIATYAMAAEGLDIKTLTTLIMATPKTDIQQSVGRILREKHNQPVVVDIIDSHETFKNQWKKRKSFYVKEKYKIIYTTSDKYQTISDETEWTIVNDINKSENKKTKIKKNKSNKSNSSTERSIINDSDTDEDVYDEESQKETIDVKDKNNFLLGKCLIKLKK